MTNKKSSKDPINTSDEVVKNGLAGEIVEVSDETSPKPATVQPAGTIIKTYVQNGLRYNRVTTENGGTVDVRA